MRNSQRFLMLIPALAVAASCTNQFLDRDQANLNRTRLRSLIDSKAEVLAAALADDSGRSVVTFTAGGSIEKMETYSSYVARLRDSLENNRPAFDRNDTCALVFEQALAIEPSFGPCLVIGDSDARSQILQANLSNVTSLGRQLQQQLNALTDRTNVFESKISQTAQDQKQVRSEFEKAASAMTLAFQVGVINADAVARHGAELKTLSDSLASLSQELKTLSASQSQGFAAVADRITGLIDAISKIK